MSGSRSFSTPDASETPERSEAVLSLKTVQKMLPLVKRIVEDILANHRAVLHLLPEEDRLDRQRHQLDWPGRQRRYRIKEERAAADRNLQANVAELHELGLVLLDESLGQIGFPTLVNNRRAYFSWHSGEETLNTWQVADEDVQHPIPASWLKELVSANA